MKQKVLHKVYLNSAKFWGIKIEIYLTTEVPMGIDIDQPDVQRNRYLMTPSSQAWQYRQCKEIPRGCATKVECEVILLNHKENKITIANEMMKMYCNQKNRKNVLFSTFRSDFMFY